MLCHKNREYNIRKRSKINTFMLAAGCRQAGLQLPKPQSLRSSNSSCISCISLFSFLKLKKKYNKILCYSNIKIPKPLTFQLVLSWDFPKIEQYFHFDCLARHQYKLKSGVFQSLMNPSDDVVNDCGHQNNLKNIVGFLICTSFLFCRNVF